MVRIDHAADTHQIVFFEFGYRGTDPGDTTDNLMAGNAGVGSRHDAAPFVAGGVKIGVADTAEQDFDLDVTLGCFTALDGGGCKW